MLKILSKIYENSINRINKRFDNNEIDIFRSSVPVISIGNLSLGGTGKTPLVIMIGRFLQENNRKIGVIGKGYKRKTRGELLVSDGHKIKTSPENSGDEMYLIAEKLNVPVLVHNEKFLAAKALETMFDLDCILLDDGFQHRKLYRNLDIVIVDEKTLNKPFLIPKGRLREPLSSLKRADVICLMDIKNEAFFNLFNNFKKTLIIECEKVLSDIKNLFDNANFDAKYSSNLMAVSGLGNPHSFINLLKSNSINPKDKVNFSDHHNYTLNTIKNLIARCNKNKINSIITTEKDAIKIKKYGELFAKYKIECFVVSIEIIIKNNKEQFFDYILKTIYK